MRVAPERLSLPATAVRVRQVVAELGQLGGYLLNDQMPRLSAADRPALPQVVGGCWPLIATRNPQWQAYLLPAFVLPLQWQHGAEDDPRLPPDLLRVAAQVRRDSTRETANDLGSSFGLGFVDRHQLWPDLHDFSAQFIEADSCYAALAMGLRSATSGSAANPQVWASAVWKEGFTPVDLLEEKLTTARRWGCRHFYVAPGQELAENSVPPGVQVVQLARVQTARPESALSKCFADALLEPDPTDWLACRQFHRAIRELDRVKADDFYDRVLFKHLIARCRGSVRQAEGTLKQPKLTHLVTIATTQQQPVAVIAGSFDVSQVLVLYTLHPSDSAEQAEGVYQQVKKVLPNCDVKVRGFPYDPTSPEFPLDFIAALRRELDAFLLGVPQQHVVFDIDRGLTLHKIGLLSGLVPAESYLVSLYHSMSGRGGIDHGSEQLFLWQHGAGLNAAMPPFRTEDS